MSSIYPNTAFYSPRLLTNVDLEYLGFKPFTYLVFMWTHTSAMQRSEGNSDESVTSI